MGLDYGAGRLGLGTRRCDLRRASSTTGISHGKHGGVSTTARLRSRWTTTASFAAKSGGKKANLGAHDPSTSSNASATAWLATSTSESESGFSGALPSHLTEPVLLAEALIVCLGLFVSCCMRPSRR